MSEQSGRAANRVGRPRLMSNPCRVSVTMEGTTFDGFYALARQKRMKVSTLMRVVLERELRIQNIDTLRETSHTTPT